MRKRLLTAIQAAVTIALLGWIFRDPEFRAEAMGAIRSARALPLALAASVAGLGVLLGFARWGIFLRVTGIRIAPWQVLRIGAVGLFFNSFLPGAVGGDAVKAGWLAARGFPASAAVLSVVMDRMSGLGALLAFSAVFMGTRAEWLMRSPTVAAMVHLLWLYLAGVALLMGASFVAASRGAVEKLPARLPGRATLVAFAATYSLFIARWRATLAASLLSVAMLLCYFLTFYFCALSLGVAVPLSDFLAFMPIVDVLAALPVSMGGFGVREGAFATLMGQLCGVRAAEAVAISFLGALVTLLWGCLGLLLLPAYRRETRVA